jgi:hypothetical protein
MSGIDVDRHAADVAAPASYDADKPLGEIEEDIAQTRADLAETLDALERKLAPRHLLEKGVDMLRGSFDGEIGRIGETVRANPIPLALIGAGIGWLLLGRTGGPSHVGAPASSLPDMAEDGGEVAAPSPPEAHAYARPKTEATGARARQAVADEVDQPGEDAPQAGARRFAASDSLARAMRDHPLAVGALAFLAGTVLGVLLPAGRAGTAELAGAAADPASEAEGRGTSG